MRFCKISFLWGSFFLACNGFLLAFPIDSYYSIKHFLVTLGIECFSFSIPASMQGPSVPKVSKLPPQFQAERSVVGVLVSGWWKALPSRNPDPVKAGSVVLCVSCAYQSSVKKSRRDFIRVKANIRAAICSHLLRQTGEIFFGDSDNVQGSLP